MKRFRHGVLALGILLAGCSLERPFPDQAFYALSGPDLGGGGGAPATSAGASSIRVSRARLAAPFGARGFQYRVGPERFESDYYHNWAGDPGELITAATIESLASTGSFSAVVDAASVARPADTLELFVSALYVDVTNGSAPTAVLRLRATLLDSDREVLMSREYEGTAAAGSRAAGDVVAAWSAALSTVLRELSKDVAGRGGELRAVTASGSAAG